MKKKILALTGPKGVGKSTFAKQLVKYNRNFYGAAILPFAGPLKNMLQLILPPEAFTAEGKEDTALGLCGKSPRYLMQTLGTEWGRKTIGEDIWVEAMRRSIATANAKVVIIDDLRFANEAELVQELDGVIYRVTRSGVEYTDSHASEVPLSSEYLDGSIDLELADSRRFTPFHVCGSCCCRGGYEL